MIFCNHVFVSELSDWNCVLVCLFVCLCRVLGCSTRGSWLSLGSSLLPGQWTWWVVICVIAHQAQWTAAVPCAGSSPVCHYSVAQTCWWTGRLAGPCKSWPAWSSSAELTLSFWVILLLNSVPLRQVEILKCISELWDWQKHNTIDCNVFVFLSFVLLINLSLLLSLSWSFCSLIFRSFQLWCHSPSFGLSFFLCLLFFFPSLFSFLSLSFHPSLSLTGLWRVSPHHHHSILEALPLPVLWVCVGAGGPLSELHHLRRLPDEHSDLAADGALRLPATRLQAHLHAGR